MRKEIDLNNWDRKEVFDFFKDLQIPVRSVTSEVDCTEAFEFCKRNKVSYAKLCCYAGLRAANEIEEFHYRVENGGKTVATYDVINLGTPIKINDKHQYVSITVPYNPDFQCFCESMQQQMDKIDSHASAFGSQEKVFEENQAAIINISCTPDLYFTSISYTYHGNQEYIITLSNMGKVVKREGRWVMPIALNGHHGLTDGHHFSLYFKKVEQYLKEAIGL